MSDLKVALFNAGLLQRVSGGAGNPPLYESRSAQMEEALEGYLHRAQPDMFLLTEVWHRRDFEAIVGLADRFGYSLLDDLFRDRPANDEQPTRTGLVGIVSRARFTTFEVDCYSLTSESDPVRDVVDASFGITQRVTLHALLETAAGLKISLFLQHLTPQIQDPTGKFRETQVLRLAEAVGESWRRKSPDVLVIAGDFNFSLEHGTWAHPYDTATEVALYNRFIEHTEASGGPVLNDAWLAANAGKPGWTIDHARNELSRSGTSSDEPDRRVDMIFLASRASQDEVALRTKRCELIFDEPVSLADGCTSMLSDHFGLEASFSVGPISAGEPVAATAAHARTESPATPTLPLQTASSAAPVIPVIPMIPMIPMIGETKGGGDLPGRGRTREPSEPLPYLMSILSDTMPRFNLPGAVGVMLIGSIAEGFGNAYSDFDFLVISEREEPFPMMRHMSTHGERRCEFFFRTARQLEEVAEVVKQHSADSEYDFAVSEEFDLYQRASSGLPLLNPALVERACAPFDRQFLVDVVAEMEAASMTEHMSRAWMFLEMGAPVEAALAARRAAFAAAAAFAARRGETYRSRKFIFKLLENAGAADEVVESLRKISRSFGDCPSEIYCQQCLSLIHAFGFPTCPGSLPGFALEAEGEVSCWEVGAGSAVLLRGEEELFLLSSSGARFWNSLGLGRAWNPGTVEKPQELFGFVRAAHQAGVIRIRWSDSGRIWSTPACHRRVDEVTFLLAAPGTSLDRSLNAPGSIAKYPLPARHVVGAIMNFLTFANYVENDREDAVGAAAKGDWDLLADSFRRQILHACIARLSVHGVYPIDVPKDDAYETILQLSRFDETVGFIESALQLLCLEVANREQAVFAHESVCEFTEALLGSFLTEDQRQTYTSAAAWYRILKLGTEWGMLADRLGVALPLDELGTLVSVVQGKEKLLMNYHSIARQLSWNRDMDFVKELDKHLGLTLRSKKEGT